MNPRPRCDVGDQISLNGKLWKVVMWITGAWGTRVTIEDDARYAHWMPLDRLRLEARAPSTLSSEGK